MKTTLKPIGFLALLSTTLVAAPSFAQDLYYSGSVGVGVVHFTDNEGSVVADTFYGVDVAIEACQANEASFDFCAGVTGFHSFGDADKTTSGGGITVRAGTSYKSWGGFIKARKSYEGYTLAPYVGVGRSYADSDVSIGGFSIIQKEEATTVFGGVEAEFALPGERLSFTFKAQYGRNLGNDLNKNQLMFAPGVKYKF